MKGVPNPTCTAADQTRLHALDQGSFFSRIGPHNNGQSTMFGDGASQAVPCYVVLLGNGAFNNQPNRVMGLSASHTPTTSPCLTAQHQLPASVLSAVGQADLDQYIVACATACVESIMQSAANNRLIQQSAAQSNYDPGPSYYPSAASPFDPRPRNNTRYASSHNPGPSRYPPGHPLHTVEDSDMTRYSAVSPSVAPKRKESASKGFFNGIRKLAARRKGTKKATMGTEGNTRNTRRCGSTHPKKAWAGRFLFHRRREAPSEQTTLHATQPSRMLNRAQITAENPRVIEWDDARTARFSEQAIRAGVQSAAISRQRGSEACGAGWRQGPSNPSHMTLRQVAGTSRHSI